MHRRRFGSGRPRTAPTADIGETIKTFCFVDNDDTRFFLTVAFINTPGGDGPLTAGYMDRDDMNNFLGGGLSSCETLFG